MARSQDPVFVVGMNGSGTTMLADSLGRHPDLYMFRFEARVLPYFLSRCDEFGHLSSLADRRRLADAMGRTKAIWQANGRRPLVLRDEQLAAPGFAGVLDGIFGEFAARDGKRRWGEKSPMNLPHIGALAQAVPGARFVHIIRDGRESAQSFHRRYGYQPVHTIYRWKKLVAEGRAQGRLLGERRYLEVYYEALTRTPQDQMATVCEFLDLPYSDRVVESSMRMFGDNADKHAKRIVENSDKWRDYFSPAQVAALERVGGHMLTQLGYAAQLQGDEDPPPWRRTWWRSRDRMLLALAQFAEYGWKGVPGLLRAARTARMQDDVRKA